MEWNQSKKVLSRRRDNLKPYIEALNRMAFDEKLEYLIVSYPPLIGKSVCATFFSAWAYGLSVYNSIIHMSYSDELVFGFSRAIKGIISSPEFAEIFPLFQLYACKPFEVERESDWKTKMELFLNQIILLELEMVKLQEKEHHLILSLMV